MRQIILGIFAEEPIDYRFFSILLERYLTHFCHINEIEADILPAILVQNDDSLPSRFIVKMKHIEQVNVGAKGLPYIFVHNDADARTLDQVLNHKWRPWLDECKDESIWLAVIPIKLTEAWMMVDIEALRSTFIIDEKDVQQVIGTGSAESIDEPKAKLKELVRRGKQKRIANFEENLAKRIRIELLEQLLSFRFLKNQIQEWVKQG